MLAAIENTLVLSLSKDEPLCSWFDKLTTSEMELLEHLTRPWR